MDGWMDGWLVDVLIATVDTSATGTKQCEAITNVAIRIMSIKRIGNNGYRGRMQSIQDQVCYRYYTV